MAIQQYSSPITEMPNPLSENIDAASVKGIIKMVHKCEQEIFTGWQASKGVYADSVLQVMNLVMEKACAIIQQNGKADIVLAGCGASGRLSFMITRSFNSYLRQMGVSPCLHYLIAGGDKSLFGSSGSSEDRWEDGPAHLQKLCENMDSVLYIGITCGLSAPYIATQLDYCMQHMEKFTPVLLGFNPPYLARNVPIEGWHKKFYEVVLELEKLAEDQKAFIMTPIIGPEPVTGSSRMKGGSATKIILESILTAATLRATSAPQVVSIQDIIGAYEIVQNATYKDVDGLSQMVDIVAASLGEGGHLHYVGYDSLAILGLIDASECPPTFGVGPEEVQGFVQGGYQMLRNREGALKGIDLSLEHFEETVLPNFRDEDVTVVLCKDDDMTRNIQMKASCRSAQTVAINFVVNGNKLSMAAGERCKAYLDVAIPWQEVEQVLPSSCLSICQRHLVEMSCKWLCNLLTTAAYVRIGKVFRNYMVAVTVRNSKLYGRAVGIVQKLGKCTEEAARECVLRVIYDRERLDNNVLQATINQHIQQAAGKPKVVPTALIMAITGCSVREAREQLAKNPIIRTAIANCMHRPSQT